LSSGRPSIPRETINTLTVALKEVSPAYGIPKRKMKGFFAPSELREGGIAERIAIDPKKKAEP
jgi:hypothetical protein